MHEFYRIEKVDTQTVSGDILVESVDLNKTGCLIALISGKK
ncbi:hypothetical protein [Chryseobacterium sp.]|nr:hypothetical protein [Chryseobacterium sp.]